MKGRGLKRKWVFLSLTVLLWTLLWGYYPKSLYAQERILSEDENLIIYENPVLGVRLDYAASWRISEDQYLFPTYGFTLSNEEGLLILRVGWVHAAETEQIEDLAKQLVEGHPGLNTQRTSVEVHGHKGVMVSPLPGIEPVSCIYLGVGERVYEIWYSTETLGAAGKDLLQRLQFISPQRTLDSIELPPADGQVLSSPVSASVEGPQKSMPLAAPGCIDWPTSKFLRVPWDSGANGNGWTTAGPSYYGENWHQNCDRPDRSNDYHALDFSLEEWNRIYAPASGTLLYYGWASGGFSTLGRVVGLDLGNGYQYLAAHLRSFGDVWYWYPGQYISTGTVIGYAEGSGNGQDGYFGVHLHQAIYKDGNLGTSGGVYGGRGVEPRNVYYYGNGGGYYQIIQRHQQMSW